MFSMSSTLVEALHLQAMIGEKADGSLETSRRNLSVNDKSAPRPAVPRSPVATRAHHAQPRVYHVLQTAFSCPLFPLKRPSRQSAYSQPWPLANRPVQDTSDRFSLIRRTLESWF